MAKYAKVIVAIHNEEVDRIFDYGMSEEYQNVVTVGVRVLVPFGFRNKKTEGYVIGLSDKTEVPLEKIKCIVEIMDGGIPIFTEKTLALALWMRKKYFCTLSKCLETIMPAGLKVKSTWYLENKGMERLSDLSEKEEELLTFLQERGNQVLLSEVEEYFGNGVQTTIQNLREKEILFFRQKTEKKNLTKREKTVFLAEAEKIIAFLEKAEADKRLELQKKVIVFLQQVGECTPKAVEEKVGIGPSTIKTLMKKGLLMERLTEKRREVFCLSDYEKTVAFSPTVEQKVVLDALSMEWEKEEKKPVLLYGVTGSGKTEVYLQLIAKAIQEGKQAIVLVPEISLTPQMVERFLSRFGAEVSVTHSRLSQGERYDQWKKARDGEISVMIGPRSALFTPFSNLGVIILDEEQENSYQSDTTPKYHGREVAEKLAKLTRSLLVMGSATPDLQSYYRGKEGDYLLLEMEKRATGASLPQVTITDMRQELEEGNFSVFGRELYESIAENLKKKEKTMLFLNRRGYATFVSCRKCGYVMTCENCNVSYTYHVGAEELFCHYCGSHAKNPETCPSCGSKYIRYFGTGTQKIEEQVRKYFPEAMVLRMDMDTTGKKNSHQRILEQFKRYGDILIGTQMIAKGHDFSEVTLVGILAADTSLYMGSYRAAENCFQLLTQAAGRAGRGDLGGRVVIQTYQPEHYSIIHAAKQDYKGFYEEELRLRRAMNYPPFSSVFSILVTGEDEMEVINQTKKLRKIMMLDKKNDEVTVLGATPAFYSKLRKEYRWQIITKAQEEPLLREFVLDAVQRWKKKEKNQRVQYQLTLNPRNLM